MALVGKSDAVLIAGAAAFGLAGGFGVVSQVIGGSGRDRVASEIQTMATNHPIATGIALFAGYKVGKPYINKILS